MPTQNTSPAAPAAPVGTPSEGGRWSWDGAQWVRIPEADFTPIKSEE